MRIISTILTHGDEARKKLLVGAKETYEMCLSTLGPVSRSNIIEQKGKSPMIINDGFYTIRSIILDDGTENLGSEALANVAKQQNKEVGDGTTTAIVLAYHLVEKIWREMEEQKDAWGTQKEDVMKKRRLILEMIPKITAEIKKVSKPIKTKEDIKNIAFTSCEDEALAEVIAEMVHKMGKDGSISVEEGYGQETKTSVISGYKFLGKYLDDRMATNDRREAIVSEPLILLTNDFIETPFAIGVIAEWLAKNHGKNEMVLIAEGFSKDVQNIIVRNKEKLDNKNGGFNCLAIKAGSLTTSVWEDLSIYTGGVFFDKAIKPFSKMATEAPGIALADFGKAKKIVVDREKTFIIDGGGDKVNIKKRVEQLKGEKEVEKHPDFKKNIEKRISALTGGVGLIEVASKSDLETEYLIGKVEDTVCSCKAAMEEGIVRGGGLALKEIADKLEDGNIVKKSLLHPWELIQKNAGGDLVIGENIFDPTKVVRMAVEHALTFAASFITIENCIAWNRKPVEDTLMEILRNTFTDVIERNKGTK